VKTRTPDHNRPTRRAILALLLSLVLLTLIVVETGGLGLGLGLELGLGLGLGLGLELGFAIEQLRSTTTCSRYVTTSIYSV